MSKWRDQYRVHPAADVFPMMSEAELSELGEDIKESGLREPIKIMRVAKAKQIAERTFSQEIVLIDGRNRLEAMERAGIDLDSCAVKYQYVNSDRGPFDFDVVPYIISLNIHRRHLNKQQRAELIVDAIKAGEKLDQAEPVSKGGRGKVNKVKAKAVAEAKKLDISESTIKRAIAKAGLTPGEKQQKRDESARARRECKDELKRRRESDVDDALVILDQLQINTAMRLVELLINDAVASDVLLALVDKENEQEDLAAETYPEIPAFLDRRAGGTHG